MAKAPAMDQHSLESLARLDDAVLAMIMARAPISKVLSTLCIEIEKAYPSLLCSVLLLDSDNVTLRTGAGPSLPEEYRNGIDGAKIGPTVGFAARLLIESSRL